MSQQHDTINAVERQKGSSHSSEELTPTVQQVVDELIAALTQGCQAVLATETTLEGVLAAVGVGYLAHAHPTHLRLAPQGQVQLQLGETCVARRQIGRASCRERV